MSITTLFTTNFDSDTPGVLPSGFTNVAGTWVVAALRPVSGTQALAAASGGDGAAFLYTGIAAAVNMGVTSNHLALVSGTNLQNVSHILRMSASYQNGYACLLNSTDGVNYNFLVFKKISGTFTQIANTASGISVANNDIVHYRSEIIGSTINLYLWINGASQPVSPNYSFSDSSVAVAGYAGGYNAAGGTGTPSMDDFTVDDAGGDGGGGGGTNALTSNTAGVLFSPDNWNIGVSTAKTINAGAEFETIFTGTTCTLEFDMTGIVAPYPQISYRIDRFGSSIIVPIAASVVLTIPSATADYATKPGHLLALTVKSMTETQARWSTQATAVALTGIILDIGGTLTAPPETDSILFYGDSITECVRTVNNTATNDTDRNDAGQGWTKEVCNILGVRLGNIGFGATGFNTSGSGGVPALTDSYNFLYAGVPRTFSSNPIAIVLMEGTNDAGDVTTNATAVFNGLIAATTCPIIVLRPFNSAVHATQLIAAIAACTTPSRCTYVNTAGFFNPNNSSDELHPYGVENITHIAPLVAQAIEAVIGTGSSGGGGTVTNVFVGGGIGF